MPAAPAATNAILAAVANLFVLFVGAKLGEELFRRIGQPAVVGELLGGFVVGPYALGLAAPGEVADVLAELGVVILLFTVGLEVRVDDLLAVGRPAVATAVIAMILPILAGTAAMVLLEPALPQALFVGLALAATSIGITSRVLADARVLDRQFSRVIIGAAVVDDVLALIAIGLVSALSRADFSASTVLVAVSAVGLLALGFAIARRARGLGREVFTWPLFADTPLVPTFMLMLAAALLSAQLGLAAIIGAFVAGLIVAETEARDELEHEMRPLALIFTPFFFAVTGARVDLGVLSDPRVALLALVLAVLGVVTKLLGAASLGRWPAAAVGAGMVPRGEVGIVVVNLGLALGVLGNAVFGALLVAVVLTTLAAPLLLAFAIPRATASGAN
ncbi:MAG: cation:proton antiporter [Chloroflexota bacterium]|nr:cation:proton antiporter [Chloroflexota bacterium]